MKVWTYKGEDLCITLYGTAGMERFEATVPPTYFRNAKAVIFVYAINDQESINNIIHWSQSLVSAKSGEGVNEMFAAVVQMIKQPGGSRATATASLLKPQEKKCCSS